MLVILMTGCSNPAASELIASDAGALGDVDSPRDTSTDWSDDPIPLDAYATESARALCKTAERCGTLYFVAFLVQEQVTDCTAQMAQLLENNLVAQLRASIAAGRIVYDPERARRCVNGSMNIACGADVETEDCRNTFQGLVPDGGECTNAEECGAESDCVGANGCEMRGTCVHVPQRGESCTVECAGDSFCDDSGMCSARHAMGASCGSDLECDPQLACIGGACAPRTRPVEGEECEGSCAPGFVCDDSERGRVCRTPRTDGTCTNALDCPERQLCQDDSTCGPYPTAGQACRFVCASGARCLEGMCYTIIETGSPCQYNGECATTHCNAGTCATPFVCE